MCPPTISGNSISVIGMYRVKEIREMRCRMGGWEDGRMGEGGGEH